MAARAGEPAWKTGTFICQSCGAEVRVQKSARIPECPGGHQTYSLRIDEPAGEAESRGHPHHGGAASPRSHRAALNSPKPERLQKRSADTVLGTTRFSRARTGQTKKRS